MARVIDSSNKLTELEVTHSFGGNLIFKCRYPDTGFFAKAKKYEEWQMKSIVSFEEEKYRSAGKAVAGAIIGGVLTGGIGLLVGAAFGGRRRKSGCYLVVFSDNSFIAFEETNTGMANVLNRILELETVKAQRAELTRKDD